MGTIQSQQESLVETAAALPGVKELADIYGRIAPYAATTAEPTTRVVYYATGGNAS